MKVEILSVKLAWKMQKQPLLTKLYGFSCQCSRVNWALVFSNACTSHARLCALRLTRAGVLLCLAIQRGLAVKDTGATSNIFASAHFQLSRSAWRWQRPSSLPSSSEQMESSTDPFNVLIAHSVCVLIYLFIFKLTVLIKFCPNLENFMFQNVVKIRYNNLLFFNFLFLFVAQILFRVSTCSRLTKKEKKILNRSWFFFF